MGLIGAGKNFQDKNFENVFLVTLTLIDITLSFVRLYSTVLLLQIYIDKYK